MNIDFDLFRNKAFLFFPLFIFIDSAQEVLSANYTEHNQLNK